MFKFSSSSSASWLALGMLILAAQAASAGDAPVSGLYKGNGKEAKLAYAIARNGEPYLDKPTIVIVLSEKDPAAERNPSTAAIFGKLGSALVLTIKEDGKIIGCEVAHAAHEKGTFSALGVMKTSDFKLADGKVHGKFSTGGEVKTFGQTWEVDLELNVKAP